MGTSPPQGNGRVSGERTRLACSLRRPVEDIFERLAEITRPAGRRTSHPGFAAANAPRKSSCASLAYGPSDRVPMVEGRKNGDGDIAATG